jgi:predicted dehydrogenase
VADVAPSAARALADQYGAVTCDDAAAVLALAPDAVYVCVPPFAHGPAEEAVLAAGAALFVEKPVAVDVATAARIADLVATAGVVTAVGHHWRYLGIVEQAAALLAGRPIRLVDGVWWDKVPPVAWWSRRDRSGGPVVEQAAHVIDLARALIGEFDEVYAVGTGTPPPIEGADVDSATAATVRFASGAVGTMSSTCALGWKEKAGLSVVADGLTLFVGEDELVVRDEAGAWSVAGDPEAARVAVDRAFVDAVRGVGDDVRVPYAEALRTHRVACAITESAGSGAPVRVAHDG